MMVTMKRLKDLGACRPGLVKFHEEFGTRAKVTRERLLMFREHATWIAQKLFPERNAAFDEAVHPHYLKWLESHGTSLDAYWRVAANALADVLGLP